MTEPLRHECDVCAAREQQRRVHVPKTVQGHLGQPDGAAHRVEEARHVLRAQWLAVLVGEDVGRSRPRCIPLGALAALRDLPGDESADSGASGTP